MSYIEQNIQPHAIHSFCLRADLKQLRALSFALAVVSIFLLSCLSALPAQAQFAAALGRSMEIEGVGRITFMDPAALQDFYTQRGMKPVFMTAPVQMMQTQAMPMLALLEDSWTHGLNPADYHVKEIRKLVEQPSPDNQLRLELIFADAAVRYGHDMTGMRVDPASIGQKAKYWRTPETPAAILNFVAGAPDPVAALASTKPDSKLYEVLRAELVRLGKEGHDYDRKLPMRFDGILSPGESARDVPTLRARLNVKGSGTTYDDKTAKAVMDFQAAHNLEPDGYIGPMTLALLNRTSGNEREQIIANLERLRWLDPGRPSRYLLVNIPSQKLWAVEDGKTVFEMKVVVGMLDRQTKSFRAMVEGIRFNPTWNVPLNIKMRDMLPKLQADPGYLDEAGIELIRGYGSNAVTLDPHQIDWSSMTRNEMNNIRMVQAPGDHNALGQIRVLMPNDYDIYMHDTNHKEFFERTQRTYSSGCIRLSEPKKVAEFVMHRNKRWTDKKLDYYIDRGKLADVPVDEPFPVFILYQTVWLNDDGKLVFGSDVYGEDKRLVAALAKSKGYYLPPKGEDDSSNEVTGSADAALVPTLVSAH